MTEHQPSEREMPLTGNVDHTGHRHTDHIVSPAVYLAVFVTLMVGTGLTVWAAQQDFGVLNTPVALAIAITKATLVILFFMHVKYSPRLMLLVVLSDYLMLGWLGEPLASLLRR
jgi:cytochrome c oxidase subunit 4